MALVKDKRDKISVDKLNCVYGKSLMAKVGSVTDLKLLKKSRLDGRPCPDKFLGLKKVSFFVATVGNNYEDAINNRLKKHGLENNFVANKSSVSAPFPMSSNGIMRQGIKDENQKYLRLYFQVGPNKSTESYYVDADGNVIDVSKKDQEEFFDKKYVSKKQENAGLQKEDQVMIRDFKVESIVYFQCGDVLFNNLGKDFLKICDLTLV